MYPLPPHYSTQNSCIHLCSQLTSCPSNAFSCAFYRYPDSDHFSPPTCHLQTKKPSYLNQTISMTSFLPDFLLALSPFYSTHSSQINYFKNKIKTWQSSVNALMTFHYINNKIQCLDIDLQDSTLSGHWLRLQTPSVAFSPCLAL